MKAILMGGITLIKVLYQRHVIPVLALFILSGAILFFNQCSDLLITRTLQPDSPTNTIYLFNRYLNRLATVSNVEDTSVFFRLEDLISSEGNAQTYIDYYRNILEEITDQESNIPSTEIDLFKSILNDLLVRIIDEEYPTETTCNCKVVYYYESIVYVEEHTISMIKDGKKWLIKDIDL